MLYDTLMFKVLVLFLSKRLLNLLLVVLLTVVCWFERTPGPWWPRIPLLFLRLGGDCWNELLLENAAWIWCIFKDLFKWSRLFCCIYRFLSNMLLSTSPTPLFPTILGFSFRPYPLLLVLLLVLTLPGTAFPLWCTFCGICIWSTLLEFAIFDGSSVLLLRFVRAPGTLIFFSVDEWNLTIMVLFILVRFAFILLMLYMPTKLWPAPWTCIMYWLLAL